jgi:hypothetical protein
MKWRMQCDEDSLRAVARGGLGLQFAELMLDAIDGGVVIEVVNERGARRVTDREGALALLAEVCPWRGAVTIENEDGDAVLEAVTSALRGGTNPHVKTSMADGRKIWTAGEAWAPNPQYEDDKASRSAPVAM